MKRKKIIIGISIAAVLAVCAVVLGVVFGVRPKSPPHEHEFDFTAITWEWEGNEQAQARVQCTCGETLVLQADVSEKNILPATCEEAGRTLFTAKFTANGTEYTDEKQVELPALGHDFDYTAIAWRWDEDAPTASANIPCKRGEHTLTLTPEIEEEILIDPACESEGSALYTAKLISGEEEYTDTNLRKLSALGHDYASEFEWEDDLSAATLYLSCKRECGKTHSERIASTFSHKDATCEGNGSDTYTVQTIYDGKSFSEAYGVVISALRHDYDYTKVEWLWQGREAKAVVRCKRDSNHSLQVETEVEEEVLRQPTCEEEGEGRYTAVFQKEGNRFTSEIKLPIPTVAHEYNFAEAVWEWDGTQAASATVPCKRNPDHTQKVLAVITMMITVEPSCEQKGIMEYTATVTDANGQKYTDVVQTELFGGTHVYGEAEFLNNKSHELVCTRCGHEELEEHENDEDKICTVCGVSTWLYYNYSAEDMTYSAWGAEGSNGVTENVVKRIVFPNYYYDEYRPNGVLPVGRVCHFKDCSALEQIVLPKYLKSINGQAFQDCTSLGAISLPSTLTDIGGSAFRNCSLLTIDGLPSGLQYIEGSAFLNCSLLSIDNLPSGLQYIGENAFYGCRSLTEITIPGGVSEISMNAFSNCRRLTSVTVESGVKTIGDFAFYGCNKINNLLLGASVEHIGQDAFYGCSALAKIKLSSELKSIGAYAFAYCSSLATVELPSGLKSIAQYAFWNCTALTEIFIPRSVETMGLDVFSSTGVSIYCEAASKPDGWDEDWNFYGRPVYWAFEIVLDDEIGERID